MTYIIATRPTPNGPSRFLGKVTAASNGLVEGYIENNAHLPGKRALFSVPEKAVLLKLGKSPTPGSVYGFDVTNLYTISKTHEYFGRISFFYTPKEEVSRALLKAFNKAAAILKPYGFSLDSTIWEINSPHTKGKWAGSYRHSKDTNKQPHIFSIKPEALQPEEYLYCILHEVAHHIHYQYMTGIKLNATWLRLYNTSVKAQTINKDVCIRLRDALIEGEERPTDFKTGLDEDDRLAYSWIIRTIKQDSGISISELNTLFDADYRQDIEDLWPKRTLHKKTLKPILTEYATTNVNELIAESLAYFLLKKSLPVSISKLAEKSLSFAKANIDNA
jgi:hypothetical protein